METPARSFLKALTWQLTGLVTMTGLAFIMTGNLTASGGLAVSAALTGFVFFILHERIWAHIRWGRHPQGPR